MADLASKLLPHEKRDLLDFWSNYDLTSPLEEVLARVWGAENSSTERLIEGWMNRNPHWSRDQVRTVLGFVRLHENIGLGIATARRIKLGDPVELAFVVAWKLGWPVDAANLEQIGEGTSDVDLAFSMALGVRDEAQPSHLVEPLPPFQPHRRGLRTCA